LALSVRIYHALKGTTKKSARTEALLGCSFFDFRRHMQAKFTDGMTWENYGQGWHADHIIPCAAFDLSKPEDQRKCFHYTNLQPLWGPDNLAKGAKFVKGVDNPQKMHTSFPTE